MTRTIVEYREVTYECDRCEGKVTSVIRKSEIEPRLPVNWIEVKVLSSSSLIEEYYFCVVCRNTFTEWRHQIRDEIVGTHVTYGPESNVTEITSKKETI